MARDQRCDASPNTSACRCTTCRTSPRSPTRWPRRRGPGDVVVTMGAGDVTMLGPEILAALAVRANRPCRTAAGTGAQMTEPEDGTDRSEPSRDPASDAPSPKPTASAGRADDAAEARPTRTTARTDLEGPRRRERRERAERRAAQARATAIEEARREAKRRARATSPRTPKPLRAGAVRGLKLVMWTVLLVVAGRRARADPVLHAGDVGAQRRGHRHSAR